jgi:hypothetical protein
MKGRFGQIRLKLTNDAGAQTELWSYRHSGVVTGFEILGSAPSEAEGDVTASEQFEDTVLDLES